MNKKEFDEYINKQISISEIEKEIDWNKKRADWLDSLDKFYENIKSFLKQYFEAKAASFKYEEKIISEEQIGEYEARRLILFLKGKKVILDPIGTNMIGARRGHVDMKIEGGTNKVKFVLVDKQQKSPIIKFKIQISEKPVTEERVKEIEWEWKIATPPPRIQFIELKEETFFDSIKVVLDG